jgi:hypothetical protein
MPTAQLCDDGLCRQSGALSRDMANPLKITWFVIQIAFLAPNGQHLTKKFGEITVPKFDKSLRGCSTSKRWFRNPFSNDKEALKIV